MNTSTNTQANTAGTATMPAPTMRAGSRVAGTVVAVGPNAIRFALEIPRIRY